MSQNLSSAAVVIDALRVSAKASHESSDKTALSLARAFTAPIHRFNSDSWEIVHAFLSSADFFSKSTFQKIISGIPSECQTDWIQMGPGILSSLIWIQSVCKGYEQTTLVDKELRNKQFLAMLKCLVKAQLGLGCTRLSSSNACSVRHSHLADTEGMSLR